MDTLERIIRARPPTVLRPCAFFIAWSGVPTLAYQGFSPPLLGIKASLEAHDSDLADENPGSRWPKTTLGALRDGHVLRWREAVALRQACDALNHRLRTAPDRLCVRALTVVRSRCKSLERRRYSLSVPLMHPEPPPTHAPPAPHRRRVERTLQQFDRQNLWAYWKAHLRDGARESHYRALHVESTLVIDVRHQLPILNAFVDRVESVLPGRYVWFSPSSRHVTLRTLRR